MLNFIQRVGRTRSAKRFFFFSSWSDFEPTTLLPGAALESFFLSPPPPLTKRRISREDRVFSSLDLVHENFFQWQPSMVLRFKKQNGALAGSSPPPPPPGTLTSIHWLNHSTSSGLQKPVTQHQETSTGGFTPDGTRFRLSFRSIWQKLPMNMHCVAWCIVYCWLVRRRSMQGHRLNKSTITRLLSI